MTIRDMGLADVREFWQKLPVRKKAWLLAIVVAGLVVGGALFFSRGAPTAAVTYVLF